MVKAAKLI